jgi:hypothetical protein
MGRKAGGGQGLASIRDRIDKSWRDTDIVILGLVRSDRGRTDVKVRCACGTVWTVQSGALLRTDPKRTRQCVQCLHNNAVTHGLSHTPEWDIWMAMKDRCHNENHRSYKRYGGRGIRVCPEWRDDFASFLACVGPRPSPKHSIERIRNNEGYAPGNVRWATRAEQARNKSNNHWISFRGETLILTDWARRLGISGTVLRRRMELLDWDLERALTTPGGLGKGRCAVARLRRRS